ncbi:MAG: VOC family protein [Paracoccaceae bacterium]
MKTLRAMPVLQVSNVPASLRFYCNLGFAQLGQWQGDDVSDDVFFAITQRGEVSLGLQLLRGPLRVNTHWAAYIYVDDVSALHRELHGLGVSPTEIRHNDYGCDDFDVQDPDGHLIAFGQDLHPVHGSGLGADGGRG